MLITHHDILTDLTYLSPGFTWDSEKGTIGRHPGPELKLSLLTSDAVSPTHRRAVAYVLDADVAMPCRLDRVLQEVHTKAIATCGSIRFWDGLVFEAIGRWVWCYAQLTLGCFGTGSGWELQIRGVELAKKSSLGAIDIWISENNNTIVDAIRAATENDIKPFLGTSEE